MLLRWQEKIRSARRPQDHLWFSPDDTGPMGKVKGAFEAIAMAQVSTSAKEGRKYAHLLKKDGWHMNRDTHIAAAKQEVLKLSKGYQPPEMETKIQLPGRGGVMALHSAIDGFYAKGMITEHDKTIGQVLAHILCGGDRLNLHTTDEQHILDLEREGFLKLCGMEKSIERIQHMLMKGKPLRN